MTVPIKDGNSLPNTPDEKTGKMKKPAICGLAALAAALALPAAAMAAGQQDPAQVAQAAEQFLQTQTAGLPGKVTVSASKPSRLALPACAALEAFQPTGSRLWGRTTVGVKCLAPTEWSVYLSAVVQVVGEYVAAAAPLKQGQAITADMLVVRTGDLGQLPADVITDPAQAIGHGPVAGLAAGAPLRRELLRAPRVVQQGQRIRLVLNGPGFTLSSEGKALAHASAGQVVQVKTDAGQVVSGVAQADNAVMVPFR